MSSLRRDLLERRLWIVVAVLVLAVIAVPLLLRKTASADVAAVPPAPAPATTTAPAERTAVQVHKALEVSMPRNPFASGMPKLASKPASQSGSTSSTTTTAGSTSTTAASMVSPTPASSGTGSTGTSGSGSTGTPNSATATQTVTTTTTSTTTPSSPEIATSPSSLSKTPPIPESWTLYSVAVRIGADGNAPIQTDIARLTPLPSVAQPSVMFMGVMDGGGQGVFALGAGVGHAGPGVCRPDAKRCAAITLSPGQTETLTVPTAGGVAQQLILQVDISKSVTHSRDAALAAYQRYSAAGLCELDLADPVVYSQIEGTLSSTPAAACRNQPTAVPFPGQVSAS